MQLTETPRTALCFGISEKYLFVFLQLYSSWEPWGCPDSFSADPQGACDALQIICRPPRSRRPGTTQDGLSKLARRGSVEGEQESAGSLGHRAGSGGTGLPRGVAVEAAPPSFTHQEPSPKPRTSSKWTLTRLGIYLIHLPNADFLPVDMFPIN